MIFTHNLFSRAHSPALPRFLTLTPPLKRKTQIDANDSQHPLKIKKCHFAREPRTLCTHIDVSFPFALNATTKNGRANPGHSPLANSQPYQLYINSGGAIREIT